MDDFQQGVVLGVAVVGVVASAFVWLHTLHVERVYNGFTRDVRAWGENVLHDAKRWQLLCELWAASEVVELVQGEDGDWVIMQGAPVENEFFLPLKGETPDACIDSFATRGVCGTDVTEGGA